jgi:hypothetical protein
MRAFTYQPTQRDRANVDEHLESDLGTAAFLVVRGFPLLGLKRIGGSRFGFRFADPRGEASGTAMAYLRGEAAPAKMLFAAERDLKTLLYSQKGNGTENGNNGDIHHRNPVL